MFEAIIESVKAKLGVYYKYIVIVIVILMFTSLGKNILNTRKAEEKINEAGKRVSELEANNAELKLKVKEAKTDEFIERQLRDKLSLAKEGEIVVVLPDDETLRKLAPKHEEEEEYLPDPNWKKWLKLFF